MPATSLPQSLLSRVKTKGLIWPTAVAFAALVFLLGLGMWQLQRKAWKDGLLAAIAGRVHAEPVGLDDALGRAKAGGDVEYLRVRATGMFADGVEFYLYAPDPRLGPGYHVIAPLQTDGKCPAVVLVNRGFVPEGLKSPAARKAAAPAVVPPAPTTATVTGLVRLPEKPNTFTLANEPGNNLWFWRDLAAMVAVAKLGGSGCDALSTGVYPFFVDAEALPANPGGWPRGGTTNFVIANRHLEYALTWFGLAATLAAVWATFVTGRLGEDGTR